MAFFQGNSKETTEMDDGKLIQIVTNECVRMREPGMKERERSFQITLVFLCQKFNDDDKQPTKSDENMGVVDYQHERGEREQQSGTKCIVLY